MKKSLRPSKSKEILPQVRSHTAVSELQLQPEHPLGKVVGDCDQSKEKAVSTGLSLQPDSTEKLDPEWHHRIDSNLEARD